jgi:glycosyltransferase involved in cell wall biosynthesis
LNALPKQIDGITSIEVLVVDDGSTDQTAEVAKGLNVHHVVRQPQNRGLAYAFNTGLTFARDLNVDYLVNIDADNQYRADDIPKLLAPLMSGHADIVVGERPIADIDHFSPLKKTLQYAGSWVVRRLSGTAVADAPSGFRAFNRRAMLRLHLFNRYSHTLETLIAAHNVDLRLIGVPIRINNEVLRESRLMKSMSSYILRSMATILRFYLLYNPYAFFLRFSALFGLVGTVLFGRFLYYYLTGNGSGWIQSLIIGAVFLIAAMLSLSVAVMCDIMSVNRQLVINALTEIREQRSGSPASGKDVTQ